MLAWPPVESCSYMTTVKSSPLRTLALAIHLSNGADWLPSNSNLSFAPSMKIYLELKKIAEVIIYEFIWDCVLNMCDDLED